MGKRDFPKATITSDWGKVYIYKGKRKTPDTIDIDPLYFKAATTYLDETKEITFSSLLVSLNRYVKEYKIKLK